MTEAMPFLQNYDITFLRPPTIPEGAFLLMPGAYKIDTIICMICLFLNRDTGYNERKR